MSENTPAIVGVQSCGCITYANARPDRLDRADEKALAKIVREGGQVVRTTVEAARTMPHFLEPECPHDPKGWEREPYIDPAERVKIERATSSGATVRKGYRGVGKVRRWPARTGPWFATKGWFRARENTAWDGKDSETDAEVIGPFKKRADAVAALIDLEAA